ncbi:hypothetical protein CMT30_12045 [Elizabethkingia anophelis]|nr:DUF3788 family protein [Elizabethkingia anophelis]MDV4116290.1 hypothetical protein [Elizabethkingia anophelis]
MKQEIEANYRQVKQDVMTIVESEMERIKNDPDLQHLVQNQFLNIWAFEIPIVILQIIGNLIIIFAFRTNLKTMSASIYDEKLVEPNDKMLTFDLGITKKYFDEISKFIISEYGDFKSEWKFYNKKSGWILKMFVKNRNVLFIVPCNKYFRVVFTFGDKASEMIFASKLPDGIKKDVLEAKKHMEGRTIQMELKTKSDLENVLELIRIKLIN